MEQAEAGSADGYERRLTLQKIYVRDASIEVPDAPRVFAGQWQPDVNVDLDTRVEAVGDDNFNITLRITVTATQGEATAYIVEVQQAGVFQVSGFADESERGQILGAYCPNLLFPYAREAVGAFIQRAGFPHFLLQPVNFDALYQQHQGLRPPERAASRH